MVYRNITDLNENNSNPRQINEKDFERLCQSIEQNKEYFEARPLILSDRTGELVIIAGNQRYRAAKKLELKQVPTHLLSGLSEQKEREIIIRDNISNGEWDWDMIANEWDVEELEDWGLDIPDFPEQPSKEEDDLPISSDYEVKLGDKVELGNHILYCSDNNYIDFPECELLFTDPPYELENQDWISKFNATTILTLCSDKQMSDFIKLSPLPFKRLYVLDTGIASPTNNDLYVNHIAMLRFSNNAKFNNIKDGGRTINKIEYRKNLDDKIHAHEKPLSLFERFILYWSNPEKLVIDPFAGSGACLIACERANRKNISCEIDEEMCSLIVQRYVNYMEENNKNYEVKINGEPK